MRTEEYMLQGEAENEKGKHTCREQGKRNQKQKEVAEEEGQRKEERENKQKRKTDAE